MNGFMTLLKYPNHVKIEAMMGDITHEVQKGSMMYIKKKGSQHITKPPTTIDSVLAVLRSFMRACRIFLLSFLCESFLLSELCSDTGLPESDSPEERGWLGGTCVSQSNRFMFCFLSLLRSPGTGQGSPSTWVCLLGNDMLLTPPT